MEVSAQIVDTTGLSPSQQRDEERRLLYVGLTRASESLFCSHAAQRSVYGRQVHHSSALMEKIRRQEEQLSLLK